MKKYFKALICFLAAVVCALTVGFTSVTVSAANEENSKWVTAWGTTPAKINMNGMSVVGSLVGDVTVRTVINPSASGEKIRIKLSNYYGDKPLKIKSITAAYSKGKSKIDENSIKIVTFNDGSPDVSVAPGEEIYSDDISLPVTANQPIAFSIFINEYQDVGTMGLSGGTSYFTTGDATRTEDYDLLKTVLDEDEMLDIMSKILEGFTGSGSIDIKLAYDFIKFIPAITSVDVLTDASGYSIIVVGDSTVANDFPEYLAQAIYQQDSVDNVGVAGKGLIGNMLLSPGCDGTARQFGDEPMQIKRKFPSVTVAVDKSRKQGCSFLSDPELVKTSRKGRKCLHKDFPKADLIILDDAFQHRAVKPSVSVVLVDYNRPVFKDHLMPLGKLRDLPERIGAADIVIVSKCPRYLDPWERSKWTQALKIRKDQHIFFTSIGYDNSESIFPEGDPRYLYTRKLILFSGIANDRPFRSYLSDYYKIIRHFDFPDHHKFTRADIATISRAANAYPTSVVMTTEKDCQRVRDCRNITDNLKQRMFYAPIKVNFYSEMEQEEFSTVLNSYLK